MNSAWSRAAFGPRQTFLNIGANVAQLALGTAASLLLVPFLVRHLGVARFGLVPLTTSLSTYLSLLGVGLNSATSRELSHALGKGDATRAGGVFSAAVATSLVLAAIMVLLTILLVPVLPRIISIPAGEEAAARWLLACVFLAFAIGTVAAPFGAASFTLNRFDLRVLVQLGQQLAYVLLVLVFFSVLGWTRLEAVGVAVLSGSLLALATSVWTHRRLLPDLRPSVRFESRQMLQIGSLGGWLVLNQLGTVLFLGIDLWVVNRLLGPTVAGRYGAVLQGSQLIRALGGALGGAFTPTLTYHLAAGDRIAAARIGRRASFLTGLSLALPVGLIVGLSGRLLPLWLGDGFRDLAGVLALLLVHLPMNLAALPLFGLQVATGHVKVPGLVTGALGLLNLGLALLLAGPVGMGVWGVALAGAIALAAKNVVFTCLFSSRILRVPPGHFLGGTVTIAGLTFATAGAARLLAIPLMHGSVIVGLAGTCLVVGLAYAGCGWGLLARVERRWIAQRLRSARSGTWSLISRLRAGGSTHPEL